MWFLKTLYYSVKGLVRKLHTVRKISVFLCITFVIFAVAHVLSIRATGNVLLSACLWWLWLPLSLTLLITIYGESIKRHKFEKFFLSIRFFGYDGKSPKYVQSSVVNVYLKKVRFKSRIPMNEWEKITPLMEMIFKKKLYTIENCREDIAITDIYLIQEALPNFIKWRDEFMQPGRKFAIGSGKTALLRCIIHQAIQKKFNVNVLDFKGSGDYAGVERETRKYRDLKNSGYGQFIIFEPKRARELLLEIDG